MSRSSSRITRRAFLATAAVAVSGTIGAKPVHGTSTPQQPNILLIMADQFRADCLGVNGNPVIKTPNLDRIGREGATFRCAYSSTPTCTPARSALLTGLSPWRHGMLGYGRVAEQYPVEMPRTLRDAGYYTTGIGKMHWHPQRNAHGLHEMLLDESSRAESPDFVSDYRAWFKREAPDLNPDATGIGWNDYRAGAYALPEELHPTRWTADRAVDFLRGYQRSQPFFLKVSFARPHSPYDPPQRFLRAYDTAEIPKASVGQWAASFAPRNCNDYNIWHGDLGEEQVRRSRQGYYGSVSFLDEQIGRVLEALEATGRFDETLIVFAADHGDMLGDHHHWRKSYAYEGSARIPFLIRWPTGLASAARGTVLDQPVELRDVLPTFLDAASSSPARELDGASVLGLLRGRTHSWRSFIDLEHDICYDDRNHWNALTDGHFKYVFHAYDGAEQLFDLDHDPAELHDVISEPGYARTRKRWRRRLINHLEQRGEQFVRRGDLVTRPESRLYSPNYPGCSCHKDASRG